ncbi:DUF4097 family beta strand repeat-containing protein [Saccharopolyspora gloriosae]|uniref:DUF4097 family beta strand repeat-containing protein n=1 Tax=Saccharopolyspora gloriosae TaxID=455344 RepID=UPI001FB5ED0D|nr:DUF4097 family beta strand repeat-containing protein [Saccharopolyspora gloriosae]
MSGNGTGRQGSEESGGREPNDLVRTQDFDTAAPIEVDIGNSIGSITVELAKTAVTHIEVRHDTEAGGTDWRSGLTGLLSWVSDQFGETTRGGLGERAFGDRGGPREPIAEAVRQTRIDLTGNRLTVRTPTVVPLRTVPLAVTVRAPAESQLGLRSAGGEVRVTGPAGRVQVQSGGGAVSVEQAAGSTVARTGSGALRLGDMAAGVQARSGSGDVEIASVRAASSVVTGSGSVWLGAVESDVLVRSGSGAVTVAEAAAGQVELITGSGELRVALRHGTDAEVDLTSTTGSVHSDLTVSEEPTAQEPGLRIFGRSGSGDALLTSSL